MIIGESRQMVEHYQEGEGGYGSRCTEEQIGEENDQQNAETEGC